MNSVSTRARVLRADDQPAVRRRVVLAQRVGLEQLHRLAHDLRRRASTMPKLRLLLDVELGVVEAVDVQDCAVHDHHLAVVARQVVGGPRHRGAAPRAAAARACAGSSRPPLLVCAISARTTTPRCDRGVERLLDVGAIEAEDDDVDRLLRFVDGPDDRRDAVVRLDNQLHFVLGFFSVHSTAAWPSGSSRRRALDSRSFCISSGTHTS